MKIKEHLKKNVVIHQIGVMLYKLYYNGILFFLSSLGMFMRKNCLIDFKVYSKIKYFKDKNKNDRCFIVATGPSLTFNDLEMLKDEKTFGMNSIVKILNKTNWKPTYYGIQDIKVYEKLKHDILNSNLNTVFISNIIARKHIIPDGSIVFPLHFLNHIYSSNKSYNTKFSGDIYSIVYDGYSVTYSLLQIAVYMGFKEIYLLGCDTIYSNNKKKQHFVESGHYDPAYKTAGDRMTVGYLTAKKYADTHGIKIYNATRGGMLEVFPRVNLDEILRPKGKE